jgi:hypothetical protein
MSPRTGRPIKGEQRKSVSLQLRISENTSEQLQECSELLGISRTEVIEQGIDIVHRELKK